MIWQYLGIIAGIVVVIILGVCCIIGMVKANRIEENILEDEYERLNQTDNDAESE